MCDVTSTSMKRAESSEETESTTTASRRGSEDSDSGVNLSEREVPGQSQPGRAVRPGPAEVFCVSDLTRQKTLDCEAAEAVFKPDQPSCSDYSSSVPMAGLPLAGAMMGLALGGPVGLLAGVKLGGVAAVGGSFLGYTGACVIKEQKEMRSYIDDHYKAEPELCITPRQEARLHRRQPSLRPDQSVRPPALRRAHSSSDQPRHLPSLPSQSSQSSGRRGERGQSSANSSPVCPRRKFQSTKQPSRRQPRPAQPPHLQSGQFRRLGDLSEEEQRSVVALIAAHSQAGTRRKQFARHHERERRAASLPDVLEESS